MGKRIVGYVISHSGKPGGPWESFVGGVGVATIVKKDRSRFKPTTRIQAAYLLASVRHIHPAARILRLVRRQRVVACPVHAHQIHGGEAEELRKGIEGLIAKSTKAWSEDGEPFDCVTESNLQRLLDSVDARDSLAHLGMNRAEEAAVVEAAMAWECARKPLLVVTQLRDDERIRLAQSQLDTSVALERAVRVLLLAKRGG